jgi:RNA polymerase sigma factor (sigma-70 family)
MADWIVELRSGSSETAWDLFLAQYRRVIFAAIYHYARDPDDAMDIFAYVTDALRRDDLRRLRRYVDQPSHRAQTSTWLVAVVHHLTIDWFRHRDGRRRLSTIGHSLPPVRRRIFEEVYLERRPYVEAYEFIRTSIAPQLTFAQFLGELRATHRVVTAGRHGRVLRAMIARVTEAPLIQAPRTGETAEQRAILADAVSSLDTEDRRIVELYVVEERPAASVASMMGLPNAKAVYNRVYRALGALRDRLEQSGIRRGDL